MEAHGLHVGISKTKARIAEAFWWPKWSEDMIMFVEKCPHCRRSDRTKSTRKALLIPVELPEGPWEKIAIDIKGPMPDKPRFLPVIMDYYSKWPEVFELIE